MKTTLIIGPSMTGKTIYRDALAGYLDGSDALVYFITHTLSIKDCLRELKMVRQKHPHVTHLLAECTVDKVPTRGALRDKMNAAFDIIVQTQLNTEEG